MTTAAAAFRSHFQRVRDTRQDAEEREDDDAAGTWALVRNETIQAPCPAGGHNADWTSHLYGRPNHSQYECRTTVTVDCGTCP